MPHVTAMITAAVLAGGCGSSAIVSTVPSLGGASGLEKTVLNVSVVPAVGAVRLQRVADVMQQFGLLSKHFNIQTMLS